MIRFENITTESFENVSLEIGPGVACKIIVGSDPLREAFFDILLGRKKPESGRVYLFGRDIWSIREKELLSLYKRVGLVREKGGLISNLKVWNNIALPSWYHKGKKPRDIENRVIDIFSRLGFDIYVLPGFMVKTTGGLAAHEARLFTFVRAVLMEAELMIYDSLTADFDTETANRLILFTREFHLQRQGRTSVHVGSTEESLEGVRADLVIKNQGKGFIL